MFKSGRWKGDKKIKALFGMQFQATQVPQLKAKALMVSLVPADVGKPTVRLEKAKIVEGNCTWENPIYETVKLVREQKTGRIKEKIYYLIVSSGSSKKGFLGEACIDFADFAETTGPLLISLPLQASDSGAILHVTIQRMEPDPDQSSGGHEQPTDESNGGSLEMEAEDYDRDGNKNLIPIEDMNFRKTIPRFAGENRGSDPPLDYESATQDLATLDPYFTSPKVPFEYGNPERNGHCRSLTDWSSESASDGSNSRRDTIQQPSRNINGGLEDRIKALERQVEVSELEIQGLRKQLLKESRREQDLSKQIHSLKEERDAITMKYDQLKLSSKFIGDAEARNDSARETENLRVQLVDIKKELQHEQHLNKNFKLRLQKTEDSNSELILAVRDLNEKLGQKDSEMSRLSSKLHEKQNSTLAIDGASKEKLDKYKVMKTPRELLDGHNGADEATVLDQKIKELHSDIEVYRKENEELRIHVENLSLDYEILKQKNENIRFNFEKNRTEKNNLQREYSDTLNTVKQLKFDVERLGEEIKTWELQYTESSEIIKELQTQIRSLEQEQEEQARRFQDDLEVVTRAKIEQMNRAIEAEEALRKTKLENADAVERQQEEFRRISLETASKLDENVKTAIIVAAEAEDLRLKNRILEELLQKTKDEFSSTNEQSEQRIAEARKEAETLMDESVTMKALLDEKKITEEKIHSEMSQLRAQYDELNHHSLQLKSENENLQKEVIRLRTNLRKNKEENMSSKQAAAQNSSNSQGRMKRNTINIEEHDKSKEGYKPLKASTTNGRSVGGGKGIGERKYTEENAITDGMPAQNGYGTADASRGEIQLRGVVKKNNGQTGDSRCIPDLLTEVEALKERNKQMEGELKEMQERYSEISLKFAEVEGERQQLVMTVRNLKNGKKH